jgi:hypothetical protein
MTSASGVADEIAVAVFRFYFCDFQVSGIFLHRCRLGVRASESLGKLVLFWGIV